MTMCQKCQSGRVAKVNGKTSDMAFVKVDGKERETATSLVT